MPGGGLFDRGTSERRRRGSWDACDVTPGPRMETSIQFVRRVRTRVWIEILRWRYDAIGTTT